MGQTNRAPLNDKTSRCAAAPLRTRLLQAAAPALKERQRSPKCRMVGKSGLAFSARLLRPSGGDTGGTSAAAGGRSAEEPPDAEKRAALRRPGGRRLACEPEHPYRFVRPCTALKVNAVRFRRQPLMLPCASDRPHLLPENQLTRPSHPGRGEASRSRADRPSPSPLSPLSSRERTRAACPTAQPSAPRAS